MCIHIIPYYLRLSNTILYHPMLSLEIDPILFSIGDPILSTPQVTAHGHFLISSLERTSPHSRGGGYNGNTQIHESASNKNKQISSLAFHEPRKVIYLSVPLTIKTTWAADCVFLT